MNINDITITSLETINAFDIATGAFKFTLDELQNATIAQTQEKTDITGKQGRKLNSLKKNKAVTISGTNGLVSGGLLEMQVGSEFENKKTTVKGTIISPLAAMLRLLLTKPLVRPEMKSSLFMSRTAMVPSVRL